MPAEGSTGVWHLRERTDEQASKSNLVCRTNSVLLDLLICAAEVEDNLRSAVTIKQFTASWTCTHRKGRKAIPV